VRRGPCSEGADLEGRRGEQGGAPDQGCIASLGQQQGGHRASVGAV
jgi:hypothetical protein